MAIVERCRARGLRTVVGGPIASSVSAAELKADHVVIGEAESLIADLARDLEQGTARPVYQAAERPADGDQPAARPEPHQDAPLLHHGRAVLARLPLQLRVLRHHRDLRPAPAHQGCCARCWPNWTSCARPAGAKRSLSSTTTSSATRRAPRNYAWRWPNGAANTRPASTSIPKLHSTWPTIRS